MKHALYLLNPSLPTCRTGLDEHVLKGLAYYTFSDVMRRRSYTTRSRFGIALVVGGFKRNPESGFRSSLVRK